MKKFICAAAMILCSVVILLPLHIIQNRVPEFEDIFTLNPSRYPTTYRMQDFKLKANDRQWTLNSIHYYSADGEILRENYYHLDKSGQSYYVTSDGLHIKTPNLAWDEMSDVVDFCLDQNILNEKYDDFERIIYRESINPSCPTERTFVHWYYRPEAQEQALSDELCTLTATFRTDSQEDRSVIFYDADWNKVTGSTSYVIWNYDKYGNQIELWIQEDCYFKTDAKGYLQMIVLKWYNGYEVIRTDDSGKPLWSATYNRIDGSLTGYTVWRYKPV